MSFSLRPLFFVLKRERCSSLLRQRRSSLWMLGWMCLACGAGMAQSSSPWTVGPPVLSDPGDAPAWTRDLNKKPAVQGNALGWRAGADRCVTALAREEDSTLWVATEDAGVWRCYPDAPVDARWRQFTTKDGLGDDSTYALCIDERGRVWVGTLNHGVSVWNGQIWKNYGVSDGLLGEHVFDIAICPTEGDVWIATNAGLSRYSSKNDSWSYITCADGLPSDQVQAIAFDRSGNIVVGTQCDGVALAQAQNGYKTWRTVTGPEKIPLTPIGKGLPSSIVNDVLMAKDDTIYVATTTGLAWSGDHGLSWSYVRGKDYAAKVRGLYGGAPVGWKEQPGAVLAEDYVSCLAQDEAGRLWLGHWRAGNEVLEKQDSLNGAIMKVVKQENSGFVKAILPVSNSSSLVARYDEGIGNSLFAITKLNVAK